MKERLKDLLVSLQLFVACILAPGILLFGFVLWVNDRSDRQEREDLARELEIWRLEEWKRDVLEARNQEAKGVLK
jgi:hypothetical protein